MNCVEVEQLFDAYLDGTLAGSLRLEFDAHRLSCTRCQQTIAMMEACGHVLAEDDPELPELSHDFATRVMTEIELEGIRPRRRSILFRLPLALSTLGAAAAIGLFAYLLPWKAIEVPTAKTPTVEVGGTVARIDPELINGDAVDVTEYILRRVDQLVAAKASLSQDLDSLAQYPLNLSLPEHAAEVTAVDPFTGFWNAVLPTRPADADEPAVTPQPVDKYRL